MWRVDKNALIGETFQNVLIEDDQVIFLTADKEKYVLCHRQTCCEKVKLQEVKGDLNTLIDSKIIKIETETYKNRQEYQTRHEELRKNYWTTFTLTTLTGEVKIGWSCDYNDCGSGDIKLYGADFYD